MRVAPLILDVSPIVWRGACAGAEEREPHLVVKRLIERIVSEHTDCKSVVAALDCPGPTWRHLAYQAYKGQREPAPTAVRETYKFHLKPMLMELGISWYHFPMAEADDVIASLVDISVDPVVICNDKDLYPLININGCRIYDDSQSVWWDPEHCKVKHGVEPWQIPDYLALAGDRSDNIPGAPGIGNKKAAKLLREYETMEKMFAAMAEGEGDGAKRYAKLLLEQEFELRLYKRLTTLHSGLFEV